MSASTKPYPTKLREPDYPHEAHVERINNAGELCWRGRRHRISSLLAGQPVGIVLADTGVHNLWFGPLMLGHISTRGRFRRGPGHKIQQIQPHKTPPATPTCQRCSPV